MGMYNKEEEFETIRKMADELNDQCRRLKIISFMSFCLKDDGHHTYYKNYIYGSSSNGVRLSEDQISGHINVANGFDTIPQDESPDLDSYYYEE